ncbi:MAG: endonuclease [Bacteroidetes bacterium]|nr:endonuclease [Bacteroidota bacterium]
MSKWIFLVWLNILFHIVCAADLFSQERQSKGIRLMFYNVENLFDISDDSVKNDEDFLPGGVMRWNYSRYIRKLNSLYKTIASAGNWNMPEIIAMCEVENRKVLQDLLFKTYMSEHNYSIIHEESPDQRGIDVCLIYRKDVVELLNYRYLIPSGIKVEDYHTRSVLYARLKVFSDTLNLFVNHWPSRRGGALAGEGMRKTIAKMVREACDTISGSINGNIRILICGDFNSTPDDNEIKTLLNSSGSGSSLINLSEYPAELGEGSYRYKGTWEMIDQIIVSEAFLNSGSGLYTSTDYLKIFRPDFLLENDPVYPGVIPFSTYRGYRYHGGFSDHLPVIIDIFTNDPYQQE